MENTEWARVKNYRKDKIPQRDITDRKEAEPLRGNSTAGFRAASGSTQASLRHGSESEDRTTPK